MEKKKKITHDELKAMLIREKEEKGRLSKLGEWMLANIDAPSGYIDMRYAMR